MIVRIASTKVGDVWDALATAMAVALEHGDSRAPEVIAVLERRLQVPQVPASRIADEPWPVLARRFARAHAHARRSTGGAEARHQAARIAELGLRQLFVASAPPGRPEPEDGAFPRGTGPWSRRRGRVRPDA